MQLLAVSLAIAGPAHAQQVRIAGSLREDPVLPPVGALWIVEAANREAVQALIATDPFALAGLRERVEILHWSKAFPGRVAVGLDYLGAAPMRGTRYGGGLETLTVSVKVDQAGRQFQSQ